MEKDTNAHQPSATSGRESLPEHVLRTCREFVDLVAKIVADAIPSHRYDVVGIAERLGLSEQTFRRRLYICTGYTPKQFITSIQMREAERLLSEYPDAKVKDVAFKCGFDETSPFSKAFKKWSGYGPLAFRKQKRIEESEDWVRLLEKYK